MATLLFISSNPSSEAPLDSDEEYRAIQDENERLNYVFDIRPRLAARVDDISHGVQDHAPAIIHFAGHGRRAVGSWGDEPAGTRDVVTPDEASTGLEDRSGLVLRTATGAAQLLRKSAIAELFQLTQGTVRLVLLNACHSDALAEAILPHVECVVGSTDVIADTAAIVFAREFYRVLGRGKSVAEAFGWGKYAIKAHDLASAEHLALRFRRQADVDRPFLDGTTRRQVGEPAARSSRSELARQWPALTVRDTYQFDLHAVVAACMPVIRRRRGAIGFAMHCMCDRLVTNVVARIKEEMRDLADVDSFHLDMIDGFRSVPSAVAKIRGKQKTLSVHDVVCGLVVVDTASAATLWRHVSALVPAHTPNRLVVFAMIREVGPPPEGMVPLPAPEFRFEDVSEWWRELRKVQGWARDALRDVVRKFGTTPGQQDDSLDMNGVYDDLERAIELVAEHRSESDFRAAWFACSLDDGSP
jgi:hypothetical protein